MTPTSLHVQTTMSGMPEKVMNYPIRCQRSGLIIASVDLVVSAGVLPRLEFWQDNVALHPIFAMPLHKLLEFAKGHWNYLAAKGADEELTDDEQVTVQLLFLALLHSLDSVRQELPSLPATSIALDNMQGLVKLAAWKYFLESKRFKFPTLSLSRINNNLDFTGVADYIHTCFEVRKDYENGVDEAIEKEKLAQADKVLRAMQDTWITAVPRKILWKWIITHLPSKYQPDAQGWLATLFLGNKAVILEYDKEDIDLAEDIIIASCPHGTGALQQARMRLEDIRSTWDAHYEAWEVVPEVKMLYVNGVKVTTEHPGNEPKLTEFTSRAGWLQACARWRIQLRQWNQEQENPQ